MRRLVNFIFMILMIFLGYWIFENTALNGYSAWLLTLGIITFIYYGFDKSQSKHGGWRVSENTLHFLALAGGFIGGWAGLFFFHHKSKQRNFYVILILSTLLHYYLIINGYFAR